MIVLFLYASGAKAPVLTAFGGTAEAVPFQTYFTVSAGTGGAL